MNAPCIPPKTAEMLQTIHPNGTRHTAAMNIALPLIGNGIPPSAVYHTLRSKFPEDVSDTELYKIIEWAQSRAQPMDGASRGIFSSPTFRPEPKLKRPPLDHARWWLNGAELSVDSFKEFSQLPIPGKPRDALALAFEMLYLGDDFINIICAHNERDGRAEPIGPGQTLTRDKWCEWFRLHGPPQKKAGAWVRPNPCKPVGSGRGGAITDSDIVAWKYLLLESDVLPVGLQLALYSKLKLPIAAVIMSGGHSAHAWVRLDAKNAQAFSEQSRRILCALEPFGIDQANKNPSRLSRLPGSIRQLGAQGSGEQSLLWLNPGRAAADEPLLKTFETSLQLPVMEDRPFHGLVRDSMVRYEELVCNRGKIGIATGIADFDRDSGGLFPGQMSVIAAETGGGKSTLALNIVNHAVTNAHSVALFSLEMGREEIADILFSLNCQIDRNHFNTGAFTEGEIADMAKSIGRIGKFPLWIFDEATQTASQIRQRIFQLKAEHNLELAVVDYAQIVTPENTDANREQQVSAIARTLCSAAKDAKVSLLLLSQLNDWGKLRESRVIAHESHNVFLLENRQLENLMIMKVTKGRRIPKRNYDLYYEPLYCKLGSRTRTNL